jgi:hypothetical protein
MRERILELRESLREKYKSEMERAEKQEKLAKIIYGAVFGIGLASMFAAAFHSHDSRILEH